MALENSKISRLKASKCLQDFRPLYSVTAMIMNDDGKFSLSQRLLFPMLGFWDKIQKTSHVFSQFASVDLILLQPIREGGNLCISGWM